MAIISEHILYSIDPANDITNPSFSWDATLRKIVVELELLTDVDI